MKPTRGPAHHALRRNSRRLQPTLAAVRRRAGIAATAALTLVTHPLAAQTPVQGHEAGGEAALVLPDLHQATFLGGIDGHTLLVWGLVVCALGLLVGLLTYTELKTLPLPQWRRESSERIYGPCKTFLVNQGKFLLILGLFIGAIAAVYFGALASNVNAAGQTVHGSPPFTVAVILLFSL